MMALLLLGPQFAIIVAAAGVWAQCTYKPKHPYPLYRTVFSTAAEVITMAATGVVYQQLGGPTVPADLFAVAKPLVAAIATYFLMNTSLVAGAISLSSRRDMVAVWRDDFLWSAISFMAAGTAGAMAAVIVGRNEHWKAILLIAPVYLTYRTYQIFVGRLDDHARHMAEIEEARAGAERASHLKDEFLAIVSHELRTPLNSILGWADMLRRGRLDEARRGRAFQAIYDSARRQAQLIDDLLDVSRIMSGKLRLERTAVHLKDVVDDALQVVQPAADAKNVRITTDAEAWLGFIQGDSARLQQIATNLLSNAVKFTPDGGSVHVQLRASDGHVEIRVRDTGQGIAAEFLPHVFEPFRQADASTTRVHGGLGLGLSIVKHLVDAHDGSVRVESAGPGRGATFVVQFPIESACVNVSGTAVARSRRLSDQPSLRGLAVLVVDDDPGSRQVVAEYLADREASVFTAASAAHAYDALRRTRVDVLLVDIAMPGEDGYSLMRRLRAGAVPACASTPAAALTAFAREEDRQLALRAGFQMHLAKPVDPAALVAAVASLGQAARSSGSTASLKLSCPA
jgi:signal transduction histidine kinase/ActR/RegA family two-component response regulator